MEYAKSFKKQNLTKRREIAQGALIKCPDRCPIIVDRAGKDDPQISKHQFLCPATDQMFTLFTFIRQFITLTEEEALFFFAGDRSTLTPSMLIGEIYHHKKSNDEFLYIYYCKESVFGTF